MKKGLDVRERELCLLTKYMKSWVSLLQDFLEPLLCQIKLLVLKCKLYHDTNFFDSRIEASLTSPGCECWAALFCVCGFLQNRHCHDCFLAYDI